MSRESAFQVLRAPAAADHPDLTEQTSSSSSYNNINKTFPSISNSQTDCNDNEDEHDAPSIAITEDDWKLPLDFQLFAEFLQHKVYYSADDYFLIECVESLTPLDMISLSNGIHDATGLCVWRGAFLFVSLLKELDEYFVNKDAHVLELGAGTGIGGIALLKSQLAAKVCFTDGDPSANELCRRNCAASQLDPTCFSVAELRWGEPLPTTISPASFHFVIATDVLYDIGLLPVLVQSTFDCLRPQGYFILAHVPRACYNSAHPPVDSLEELIIRRAKEGGLALVRHVVPNGEDNNNECVWPKDALNNEVGGSLQDMKDAGASILVFQKL
jgi:ribosomal protein L11 methylase PrmA